MEDNIDPFTEEKQNYLRQNILDRGYDGNAFANFLVEKRGEDGADISSWSLNDLKNVVDEFIALSEQQNNENNNAEQNENHIEEQHEEKNEEQQEENPEVRKQKAIERINNLNSSLYYVKGINGDMLPTESVYAAFIQPLSEFTQDYPDREYINTSMVGAQIDGFKNLPLEEALKDSETVEKREVKTDFQYDIQSIKDNLFKEK